MGWLGESSGLAIIGEGGNILPTLHIKDLSRMVHWILDLKPMNNYFIAVDRTVDGTQSNLVTYLAEYVAGGNVRHITKQEAYSIAEDEELATGSTSWFSWVDAMLLNLNFLPSQLFDRDAELEGSVDVEEPPPFNWHSQGGLAANMELVIQEFQTYRGLFPTKIVICGPPASGKSFYTHK